MPHMKIQLLNREYKLSYEEGEYQLLNEAITYVERNMRDIRDKTKLVTAERIAVLSSIMIAMRLLDGNNINDAQGSAPDNHETRRKLNRILQTIEAELLPQENLFELQQDPRIPKQHDSENSFA